MVNESGIQVETISIQSGFLQRIVKIDIYQPKELISLSDLSLLLINDGQDMEKMSFVSILDTLYDNKEIRPFLAVGIHCSAERKREYGTAAEADYKDRGDKAGIYTAFVMQELLPFIYTLYKGYSFREKAFAGFSLGALSAMDIVWNHPGEFSKLGCFSSSFWWRSMDQLDPAYDDDKHRIMHQQIRRGHYQPSLKFFFQCGNMDETRDRNKNGIIDSIDDTLDIIKELEAKGYQKENDIQYLELADGHHDVFTWGRAMPVFLKWAYPMGKMQ